MYQLKIYDLELDLALNGRRKKPVPAVNFGEGSNGSMTRKSLSSCDKMERYSEYSFTRLDFTSSSPLDNLLIPPKLSRLAANVLNR